MKDHPLSRVEDADVDAVRASGAHLAAGDLLVILTLQKDTASAVSAQGPVAIGYNLHLPHLPSR
jgi:hypothetical protein